MHRPQVCADRPASTFPDENSLLSYLLCLLVADLFYYMVHCCSPSFSGLWAAHAVLLSSEDYNLATGVRATTAAKGVVMFFEPSLVPSLYTTKSGTGSNDRGSPCHSCP